MKNINALVMLLTLTPAIQVQAEQRACTVNLAKTQNVNCGICGQEINILSKNIIEQMASFIDRSSHEIETYETYRQLILTKEFLDEKKNKEECSNFENIKSDYDYTFEKTVQRCTEKPTPLALNNRNTLCNWAVKTHLKNENAKFINKWSDGQNSNGEYIYKPNSKELKTTIKSEVTDTINWCNTVNKNWSTDRVPLTHSFSINMNCDLLKFNLYNDTDSKPVQVTRPVSVPAAIDSSAADAALKNAKEACDYLSGDLTRDAYMVCVKANK